MISLEKLNRPIWSHWLRATIFIFFKNFPLFKRTSSNGYFTLRFTSELKNARFRNRHRMQPYILPSLYELFRTLAHCKPSNLHSIDRLEIHWLTVSTYFPETECSFQYLNAMIHESFISDLGGREHWAVLEDLDVRRGDGDRALLKGRTHIQKEQRLLLPKRRVENMQSWFFTLPMGHCRPLFPLFYPLLQLMFNINLPDDWIRTAESEATALPTEPQPLNRFFT